MEFEDEALALASGLKPFILPNGVERYRQMMRILTFAASPQLCEDATCFAAPRQHYLSDCGGNNCLRRDVDSFLVCHEAISISSDDEPDDEPDEADMNDDDDEQIINKDKILAEFTAAQMVRDVIIEDVMLGANIAVSGQSTPSQTPPHEEAAESLLDLSRGETLAPRDEPEATCFHGVAMRDCRSQLLHDMNLS